MNKCIFLMSIQQAGGIKNLAKLCQQQELKTCLLTDVKNDSNANYCDDSLLVNWHGDYLSQISAHMQQHQIQTAKSINLLEELLGRHDKINQLIDPDNHYNIQALQLLADKALFRQLEGKHAIISNNLPALKNFQLNSFPVILKPSQCSGGSTHVYTCHSQKQLCQRINQLRRNKQAADLNYIIEPYFGGQEYSLDCLIDKNEIIPLLYAEKHDFNYTENKDGDRILAPSINLSQNNKYNIIRQIRVLIKKINLQTALLHVEFRVDNDECHIIEVNPRFGGRLYSAAIRYLTGADVLSLLMSIQLSTHQHRLQIKKDIANAPQLLFVSFHGKSGETINHANHEEMAALPFVEDYFFIDGFQCANYQRENIFAEFLISGDCIETLLQHEEILRKHFRYNHINIVQPS